MNWNSPQTGLTSTSNRHDQVGAGYQIQSPILKERKTIGREPDSTVVPFQTLILADSFVASRQLAIACLHEKSRA